MTPHMVMELFDYNENTGLLLWRCDQRCGNRLTRVLVRAGDPAGMVGRNGYIKINYKKRTFLAHRLIWAWVHGRWPDMVIDHINGDKADNRIVNLRDVSPNTNAQNVRCALAHSSTGLLGASRHRDKYQARIKMGGRTINLGTFDTPEEAHAAYVAKKRLIHDGCTI